MVHDFKNPQKEELGLLHKFIKAFNAQLHFLQITSDGFINKEADIESDMATFAALNNISEFQKHIIQDKQIEAGVVHFNQMNNMDLVCLGTHGKGSIFHQSAINGYKPYDFIEKIMTFAEQSFMMKRMNSN